MASARGQVRQAEGDCEAAVVQVGLLGAGGWTRASVTPAASCTAAVDAAACLGECTRAPRGLSRPPAARAVSPPVVPALHWGP